MSPENNSIRDMSFSTSLVELKYGFTFLIINKLLFIWFSITDE